MTSHALIQLDPDELKTLAIELQDLIQSKVGTTKFSSVYNTIRQNALSVRRERKTQRAIQVRNSLMPMYRSLTFKLVIDDFEPRSSIQTQTAAQPRQER